MIPKRCSSHHGSALIIAAVFVAVFSVLIAAFAALTTGTGRLTYRQGNYLRTKAAADGMADLVYGRFSRWVSKNNGLTPSINDIQTADATNPAILDPNNLFLTSSGASTSPAVSEWLANFSVVVNNVTPRLVPVFPDDSEPSAANGSDAYPNVSGASTQAYRDSVKKFQTITPGVYDHAKPGVTTTYKLVLTVRPTTGGTVDSDAVTIVRYFQQTTVNPFEYGRFNNGSLSDGSSPRLYNGPLYAAYNMNLTGTFTIQGNVEYGNEFHGPNNALNVDSNINFQNGGVRRQTTLIEIIPDIVDVLSKSNGSRANSVEAGTDDFSVREVIEVPVNPATDKSQIASRRIYNKASLRVHVNGTTVNFIRADPTTAAVIPWTNSASDIALQTALQQAIKTQSSANQTFYDANLQSYVKATDVNVGALKSIMDNTNYASSFPSNVIYIWDDTTGNNVTAGVRLYNGGELPSAGLVVGTNNIAYIKGDYNTGTQLLGATSLNNGTIVTGTEPASNGLSAGAASTATQRSGGLNGTYVPKPAGVFADGITELSQNWLDSNSTSPNRTGRNTTLNLAEGLGSGKGNERNLDDTFHDSSAATIHWLENYSGKRRTTAGSEMQLYHSLRTFSGNAGGMNYDTSYNANVVSPLGKILNWGSIVFSRNRYYRFGGVPTQKL